MAQTLIGHRKSILGFLLRQIKSTDVVILTDAHTQWEAKKKTGIHVTSQYAPGTFADERGIKNAMSGKCINIWIGPKSQVSDDTLRLYNNELKDVPMKSKKAAKKSSAKNKIVR